MAFIGTGRIAAPSSACRKRRATGTGATFNRPAGAVWWSATSCISITAGGRATPAEQATATAAAGKPIKFRFHLKNAKLYAFWVSGQESGASQGYVAAGGPGLTNRCT